MEYNDFYITFCDKKYFFNFDKLNELCQSKEVQDGKEREITEAYQLNDDNVLELSSKINREVKSIGGTQMLTYDVIKMFLVKVLDDVIGKEEMSSGVGVALSVNTLIKYGILEEIKE